MTHKEDSWQINFVSSDPVLIERIRFHNNRNNICNIEYSVNPLDKSQDIYIIPATDIPNLPDNIVRISNRLPVIAYGSRFYLIKAFNAGCMDYLKEPWEPEELFLRLERILSSLNKKGNGILFIIKEKATNNKIEFSFHEMEILKMLLKHKGLHITRDTFIKLLSNKKLSLNKTRTVDMHISNIRKKLKFLNINLNISCIRGIGYRLSE